MSILGRHNGVLSASLIWLCFILASCSRDTETVIVAQIDDLVVTDQHYLNALKRYYKDTGQGINLSREVKLAVLTNLLDRYAGVKFAQEEGWHLDDRALFERALIERKVLMEEYQRRYIYDDVYITDDDLRRLFLRLNTQLRASHLYAADRVKADSLYRLVTEGASFEQLAPRVFASPALAANGGDLGFFTVDEMDITFEDVAYELEVGEVSEPVRTSSGFSIIKVTDRREKPIITENEYANARARIYPLAVEQKKDLATRADIEEKVQQFSIRGDLLQRLWKHFENGMADLTAGPLHSPRLPSYEPDVGSSVLVDYNGFVFSVDEFLAEALFTPPEEWEKVKRFHNFKEFVEGVAYRSYAIDVIRNSNRIDSEFVAGAIDETFYSYLYRRFDEYVEERIELTEEELKQEYAENRSYYIEPTALNLIELGVETWATAEIVMDELNRGQDFMSVFRRYAIDDALKSRGGELGFINLDRFGTLSIPLADVQPGQIRGPFQVQNNRIVIFKCLARREERPLAFEEAREMSAEYLRHVKKEDVRRQLLDETKEKHRASVDLDEMDKLVLEM